MVKNKVLITIAVLMALVGIIWFGQGIGVIQGSVMTDDIRWAVIGGIMIVAAAGIFWYTSRQAMR